jgi:hypothetical protein
MARGAGAASLATRHAEAVEVGRAGRHTAPRLGRDKEGQLPGRIKADDVALVKERS